MEVRAVLHRYSKTAAVFDRLYLFSFAWAVATVLHAFSFLERLNFEHPFTVATVLAAALVLLAPQNVWLFLLMLCCSVSNTLEWMPYAPNHITFDFIVNCGTILALVWTLARRYRTDAGRLSLLEPAVRQEVYAAFAPFVRISLFILYFWAVFHKLNWDYFNINSSCSTFLLDSFIKRLPFLPYHIVWVKWAAVWGTLLIEAAIPLLLCARKIRLFGILLGFGFHYFLAIHPHPGLYSFSGMLFALYMLFVPAEYPQQLQAIAQRLLGSAQYSITAVARMLISFGIIAVTVLALNGISSHRTGLALWLTWGLLLMGTHVLLMRQNVVASEAPATLLRVRPAVFWFIPVLIFFNGTTPYLGLKTQTSFSMFSNLRVEGDISNHLLIPTSTQLTNLEKDLVDVTDTNLKTLQPFVAGNQLITYFELQRFASEATLANASFYVRYVRNHHAQTLHVVNGHSNLPAVTTPHSWLAAKFIRFRPVDKGPCLCKH